MRSQWSWISRSGQEKISVHVARLTRPAQAQEDRHERMILMDTQSLATIATPFLVFGAVFVVLVLIWDR